MATLVKNHDRWYLQFYEGDRVPSRKRVPLRTKDKRLAEKLRRFLEEAYLQNTFDPWRDDPRTLERTGENGVTVLEGLTLFLNAKSTAGRAPNTIRAYGDAVGLWAKRIGEETPLRAVRVEDVEAFVYDATVSPTTQGFRYRHVRAYLRWLRKHRHVARDLMEGVESPKPAQSAPKAVTEPELDRICRAVWSLYRDLLKSGGCRRGEVVWRVPLFRFAYMTGLRSSELARLKWQDIDLERGMLTVRQQKNGRVQTVPLVRPALDLLERLSSERRPSHYVFHAPGAESAERSPRAFAVSSGRAFTSARDRACIGRPLTFHGLRHGFCTRLAEAGRSAIVIKEAARHADVSTSMIYVSLANEVLKETLDGVF